MRRKFSTGQKRIPVSFEKKLFLTSFDCFGASFSKNRQKLLSPATKLFLRVVGFSDLYETITWTLNIIFHMHDVVRKCLKQILQDKHEASLKFEKTFSRQLK